MIVALFLAAGSLGGCSKALTESSAPSVIQKWIDSQNGGLVSTNAGALTSQVGTEMIDAWSVPDVRRLIKLGFLEEKTVSVSYPHFAGQYSGVHHEVNMFGISVSTPSVDTLDVQTVSNTRPPHVEGRFRTCFDNNCDVGSVSGAVERNGPSTLALSFAEQGGSMFSNRPSTRNRLVVALERGPTDAIVGQYLNIPERGIARPIYFRVEHLGPNPQDIQQDVYVYKWTNNLPTDTFTGGMLNLGHLVVESCEHLLPASETAASAACKTHVKLTAAAEAVFGSRPTDGLMQASFGKQPDGTWIGTSIKYSPPPYGISSEPASGADLLPAPPDVSSPPADAFRTATGVVTKVIRPGSGKDHPSPRDTITFDYAGWTADGKMFDRSRGGPTSMLLSAEIPGLIEGIQMMVVEETRRFWIPQARGFEAMNYPPNIFWPKGMLIFDIRLIAFRAAPPGTR
jgi:FKBP-type peptidyl-prolyl cis-trans isomerases 1